MSPLGRPIRDLSGFPRHELRTSRPLYRIHRWDLGPWWFSSDGSGRFDLRPPDGTCYTAEDDLGAFIEVFRDVPFVAESDVQATRVSTLHVPREVALADCTHGRARAFGVSAAIHSTEQYERTQEWASAFRSPGFGGIRYLVGHDPRQRLVGVALFGEAGQRDWPAETAPIGPELPRTAHSRFGIIVLPAPR